jgi:DNA-binding GntR family transcriptional regulator
VVKLDAIHALSPGSDAVAETREDIVETISATLQARVMTGEIPIGSWLRQQTIAEEFGVSRTPVREALRKLEASGTIELHLHRGALVRGTTAREIREAYDVRAELEGYAAELAAFWVSPEQVAGLHAAIRTFEEATASGAAADRDVVRLADHAFHEQLHVASGNELLHATIRRIHRRFTYGLTWMTVGINPSLVAENAETHEAVLGAVERHDGAEARRLMSAHVRRSGELVGHVFERRGAPERRDDG